MPPSTYAKLSELPTREPSSQRVLRNSFAKVLASGWSQDWHEIVRGAGMAVSQASGNGLITTGTGTNEETIMRLQTGIDGRWAARAKVTLSQRIVNQQFYVELVDILGDGLAYVIDSTTQITVTLPEGAPQFDITNLGQSISVGALSVAGSVPGRYPIAAIDTGARTITLTVSGFPASGNGSCSLFGWNGYRVLYDGTTATNAKLDSYRSGWGSGDTTVTISTTASSHVLVLQTEDVQAQLLDTTANSLSFTTRGQRTENIPDQDVTLHLQIRAVNGTVAPASTTTFTIGFVSLEEYDPAIVSIASQKNAGLLNAVTIAGGSLASNQSVNLAQLNGGTVATGNGTSSTNTLRVALVSDQTTNTNPLLIGGTGATSIGKARDGAAGATDTAVPSLYIRRDIPTALTPAAGDYEVPQINAKGAIWFLKAGAPSTTHTVSAASTNATSTKASAGVLHDASANNLNAAARYLKLYDKASAPTVGTDTPKRVMPLPPASSLQWVLDLDFPTGIAWALTTGIANADTGAVSASEHAVGLSYA